jgi:hypothetical protein
VSPRPWSAPGGQTTQMAKTKNKKESWMNLSAWIIPSEVMPCGEMGYARVYDQPSRNVHLTHYYAYHWLCTHIQLYFDPRNDLGGRE